jgi:uncharacterized protein
MNSPGRKRLVIFTRYPVPGKVKTRLIPSLGSEGAAALHRQLLLRTFRAAGHACEAVGAELEIRFDGGSEEAMRHWLGEGQKLKPQAGANLGERMSHAMEDSFREGSPATIIIGSDCPSLTPAILIGAFERLEKTSVVLGPAIDGGYYLVGLTHPLSALFQGVPWGTATVLAESLRILHGAGIKPELLVPLDDLDRPEDLAVWERLLQAEAGEPARISVIIPALNEESQIMATLHFLQQSHPYEIIVADGGSTDRTPHLAKEAGARVVMSKRGRARQMNAGAAMANGQILLFLHVDTLPPPDWPALIPEALRRPRTAAGAFALRIAEAFPGKSLIEGTAGLRSRWLQLPYGDQGLFLTRSLFERVGGFADLPIMEDYEMVRRLRRFGKIVTLKNPAITSGRRWKHLGAVRTTLINQMVLLGYHIGLNPHTLRQFYGRPRR